MTRTAGDGDKEGDKTYVDRIAQELTAINKLRKRRPVLAAAVAIIAVVYGLYVADLPPFSNAKDPSGAVPVADIIAIARKAQEQSDEVQRLQKALAEQQNAGLRTRIAELEARLGESKQQVAAKIDSTSATLPPGSAAVAQESNAAWQDCVSKSAGSSQIPCAGILQGGLSPTAATPPVANATGTFHGDAKFEFLQDGSEMRVVSAFGFTDSKGIDWTVPPGAVISGSAIPRAFWGVLGGPFDGEFRRPIAIYEYFATTRERSWQSTAVMLYEALIASGVSEVRAKVIYASVSTVGPRWANPGSAKA